MSTSKSTVASDFPAEHLETVRTFQESLNELEKVLKSLLDVPLSELEGKTTAPLEKAKLDIISSFALNSLTWMWLRTKGENPKETEVCLLYRITNTNLSNFTISKCV